MVVTANSHVILATSSIYLKSRSQIRSGNVSANGPGSKPFLNSKNELKVGSQVIASESSRLSGQDVRLKSKAKIYGTLNYENLKADRKSEIVIPNEVTAGYWPVVEALPDFVKGAPGTKDCEVRSKKRGEIESGSWGKVCAKSKSTLVFTGGTYYI